MIKNTSFPEKKISVTKFFTFDAAHRIPNHKGACSNLHGHTYKVEITITGQRYISGSPEGMVIDFGDIKKVVGPLISQLDHSYLNDIIYIPTAENLAEFVGLNLIEVLPDLSRVAVWETPTSYAEWKP